MVIRHLSYVACDVCGDPGQPADDARGARAEARVSDYFVRVDGRDLCQRHRPDRPSCPDHGETTYARYGFWFCSIMDCRRKLGPVGQP